MYYARKLKFGAGLTRYPLPPMICVVDKNEAFFAETKPFAKFYSSKSDRYDWDRAASTPCPNLVADILASLTPATTPYVYDLTKEAEEEQFVAECRKHLTAQLDFLELLEKKSITEENFLDVYEYWNGLFGDYVRNGRKPSVYFLADIEQGQSVVAANGQVFFSVSGVEGMIPKTLKYLNSNNDQKIRDGFFQYVYERGFIFSSRCFQGTTAQFPVGFLVWNLGRCKHLKDQTLVIDVFNETVEKVGVKAVPSVERTAMLNKWVPRPKWDGVSIMPTFSSGLKAMTENKDKRDHIAPGFLFSMSSNGDDLQHQNSVFMLSAPYANAGAFSVTPENFERAMVLYSVKKIPDKTWANDRDTFYAPSKELSEEFIADCVVWAAFSGKNNCVALRDVPYKGKVYQIINNLYPFSLDEIRRWSCANGDIAAQMAAANEDRYLATWLNGRMLSAEAAAVMFAAKKLYQVFYSELMNTRWMQFKIETRDVGIYQVRAALKDAGLAVAELAALKSAHDALRAKLLPQVYSLGFLNPDVEYFK